MSNFDPLTAVFWQEVGTAVLCGAIVGLERELRGKPAGLRTSILICLGTYWFVRIGGSMVGGSVGGPSRVLGQIITGFGFIGGGVIFGRDEVITGVTTTAVVWMLAAIGALIGIGESLAAITMSVLIIVILTTLDLVQGVFRKSSNGSPSD